MVVTCPNCTTVLEKTQPWGLLTFHAVLPALENGSISVYLRDYWKGMNVSKLFNMSEFLFKKSFGEIIFRSSSNGKILAI